VQRWLPADTGLIEYYVAEDELLAIVVRRDRASAFRALGRSAAVAELVDRLHFQLRRALRPDCRGGCSTGEAARDPRRAGRLHDDALRALSALYDILLRPLAAELAGLRRLVVVPHGALHAVPLAALWNGTEHVAAGYECVMARARASCFRRATSGQRFPAVRR